VADGMNIINWERGEKYILCTVFMPNML
jgi:hypothetical protein